MKVRHIMLATAATLVLVGSALAAAPTKNGLYIGKLTGRGLEKRIELHVAKTGKTATAGLYCANTLSGKLKPFHIRQGPLRCVQKGRQRPGLQAQGQGRDA
ncbi:MAG TPA: hypothetical protein VF895_02130 [Gaiellaceae bacterium]